MNNTVLVLIICAVLFSGVNLIATAVGVSLILKSILAAFKGLIADLEATK